MLPSRAAALVLALGILAVFAGPANAAGHITYSFGEELFRVDARAGAKPQNVTAALNNRFPGGGDQFLNQSPDGKSLLIQSTRLGCSDTPCLAVISSDLRSASALPGQTAETFSAVGNGGRVVVYPAQTSGGSRLDLFVTRRKGGSWSKPRNLTGRSSRKANVHPAISTDSKRVLHNCGNVPDPSLGPISICETRLDGKGTRVRLTPSAGRKPQDTRFGAGSLHHGDYLGRGKGLVFESQWCCEGESIWWLPKGKRKPRHVPGASGSTVAPCGLPDGRVATLDLTRNAENGLHELMLASPTSKKRTFVLPAGIDVNDIGIGCGA